MAFDSIPSSSEYEALMNLEGASVHREEEEDLVD